MEPTVWQMGVEVHMICTVPHYELFRGSIRAVCSVYILALKTRSDREDCPRRTCRRRGCEANRWGESLVVRPISHLQYFANGMPVLLPPRVMNQTDALEHPPIHVGSLSWATVVSIAIEALRTIGSDYRLGLAAKVLSTMGRACDYIDFRYPMSVVLCWICRATRRNRQCLRAK